MKINNTKNSALMSAHLKNLGDLEMKNARNKDRMGIADRLDSAQVQMSPDGLALQKAKMLANPNGINEAKVARLQKLIDEGKYNVDSSAIADRLVDEHLKMNNNSD